MRAFHSIAALLVVGLIVNSCATPRGAPGSVKDIQPGQEPEATTDEAGLWLIVEEMEQELATSGRVITDKGLNTYIRQILCKLVPSYCSDIRFYIVETPHFNAMMAPNGYMEIWTGLMLRAQNEAQLAYVIGHEIGHYLRRHSLQQWRNVKDMSDLLIFVQMATSAAGVGYAGDIASLAAMGNIMAFSRDQEREADDIGFDLMVRAGYDPREAARLWQALIAERKAAKAPEYFIFFTTHPPIKERIETLKSNADQIDAERQILLKRQHEYFEAIRHFRASWLRNELQKYDFEATRVVIEFLIQGGDNLSEIYFYQGELNRIRGQEGDVERAIQAYQKADALGNAPPETYRSLGLVCLRKGLKELARDAFRKYLLLKSDASDRLIIESYIKGLE